MAKPAILLLVSRQRRIIEPCDRWDLIVKRASGDHRSRIIVQKIPTDANRLGSFKGRRGAIKQRVPLLFKRKFSTDSR